jgi:lipopolysaccharide/colanic/teichoic acid biosynthesis glycosyltransferase
MFSQHPFTLQHRYSLDVLPALPAWKRVLDVTCCIALLPLFAIVTLVVATLLRFFSNGPILYRQKHTGCMGYTFGAYRFRTMRLAQQSIGESVSRRTSAQHESQGDRLIPGGRFLRSSGLVDLPQIVNVLRGEMSMVGLRPCSPASGDSWSAEHQSNLAAVPGLTGIWRLARMSRASADDAVRWERNYAANMSLASDLKVIGQTTIAMLGFHR